MNQPPATALIDAQEWLAQYSPEILPVCGEVRDRARLKLQSASGNARNVAAIIAHCPALSLQLLSRTNQQLSDDKACQTLDHAISLLGDSAVIDTLENARLIEQLPDSYCTESYREALAVSRHSAFQVQQWCQQQAHWQPQTPAIYWASLTMAAPRWLLWVVAAETMLTIDQHRAARHGKAYPNALKHQLGLGLPELAQALTTHWQLPPLCQQAWHWLSPRQWLAISRGKPDPLMSHGAFAVLLANQLCQEANWDWYSQRCHQAITALATALDRPQHKAHISGWVHQIAADFSQQTGLPAAGDLLGHNLKALREALQPKTDAETAQQATITEAGATGPDSPPQANNKTTHEKLYRPAPTADFASRLATASDNAQRYRLTLQHLCDELGMARTTAAIYNAEQHQLNTHFCDGVDIDPVLKQFKHRIQGNDFFNMLLQKPVGFRLHEGNYKKFWPLLPAAFKDACLCDEFFMMSIFTGTQASAVIYADRSGLSRALSNEDYLHFKKICAQLSRALTAAQQE